MNRQQEERRHRADNEHCDELSDQPTTERRGEARHRQRRALALAGRNELQHSTVIEFRLDADVGGNEEHQEKRTRHRESRREYAKERVLRAAELAGDLAPKVSSDDDFVAASGGPLDYCSRGYRPRDVGAS